MADELSALLEEVKVTNLYEPQFVRDMKGPVAMDPETSAWLKTAFNIRDPVTRSSPSTPRNSGIGKRWSLLTCLLVY